MDTSSEFRNVSGLDHIDRGIIEILSQRARISLKQLAGAVGLSSPTVAERVKRLEERSYILGYTAVLDHRRLGYPLQALVRINPVPGSLHEVERMIQDTPEFVECDRVTGEDCFVGRLYIRTIEELDSILDRFHENARTNTAIVKGQPVKRRLPPLVSSDDDAHAFAGETLNVSGVRDHRHRAELQRQTHRRSRP